MLPQFGKSELSPLKKDKSTQRGKKRKGICLFIKSMSEKKHSFATSTGTADDGSAVFSDRWFTD